MALRGSLEVFGLADILQLIHFQRKSGVLTLEGEKDRVKLFFLEGNIVGAISKRRQEDVRLGKVLLKRGILKDEDLQIALEEQRKTGKKLGSILVKRGVVDKEHIKEVLTGQITETVLQIFGWEKGTYEFTPQAIALDTVGDEEVPITLDTQHLLMEGLRILDEWSLLEGRLTLDTVLMRKTEDIAGLSEEEHEILSLVDGENDLSTIIDISGKDGFVVAKVLFSLIERGVVESKEAIPVVEAPLKETKKPMFSYPFLRAIAIGGAIAVSVLLSFSLVFLSRDDTVKKFRASKTVENLRYKIEEYKFEHGEYPETLDMISKTLDPWKRPYIYRYSEDTLTIMSMGADGKAGTRDDIF
jgi:hypothetical protein